MAQSLRGAWLVLSFLLLTSCSSVNQSVVSPQAARGILDLGDWDFKTNGQMSLSGEWEFYWRELLAPSEIKSNSNFIYEPVPDNWSNYEINGQALPPEGFATYRLVVHLPDPLHIYGLYIEGEGTAYTLWVDGKLAAQDGQVGITPSGMIPYSKPQSVFFQPNGDTTEFVIQISNFQHRKAGFRNALTIGLAPQINSRHQNAVSWDAFIMGIYLVMALYHIFIYGFRRSNRSVLYFSLFALLYFIRAGLLNQKLFVLLLPAMNWETALRIEYLTFYLVSPIYALFIQSLYPNDVPRWAIRVVIGLAAGFIGYMILTDTLSLSYTTTAYQGILLVEIAYYIFFIGRIITRKREGAYYIACASIIVFTGGILEILSLQHMIPFDANATPTFLAFVVIQAVMLSDRLSKSFHRVEVLSSELEKVNSDLRKSEKKYRSIFEDSKDMIFIAMLDEQIIDSNPASRELLGYSRSEMVQMKMSEVLVHRHDKERLDRLLWRQPVVKDYELELQHKEGNIIHCTVTLTLRKNEEGKVTELQGTVHDISAIKQAQAERTRAVEFEQLAITDPLTKIYNRRIFDEIAIKEWERSKRSKAPLGIVLFDIDHFKKVNDTHGHLIGDQVLVNLAELCSANLRSMDVFARYGGEEFVILMPDADETSAHQIMERLRTMVEKTPLATHENVDVVVTISAGIAMWKDAESTDISSLLERADQALYSSKKSGRNRVAIWGQA